MIHFSGENRRIRRAVNTDRLIGLARSHTRRYSIWNSRKQASVGMVMTRWGGDGSKFGTYGLLNGVKYFLGKGQYQVGGEVRKRK